MKFLIALLMALPLNVYAIGGPLGNAVALRGKPISTTAPTDGQALTYVSATGKWTPGTVSAAGDIESVIAGLGVYGGATSGAATVNADQPNGVVNCSLTATVGSSALTVALKDGAGSALSATSPCKISFRNATVTTGSYAEVSTTGASAGVNTVVVSNGSSLGCTVSAACTLYVYAINNAGTVEIGVRNGSILDEATVQSSTAEGGAGAADSSQVLYATNTRANMAVRFLGRVTIAPAASFAWTNAASVVSPLPVLPDGNNGRLVLTTPGTTTAGWGSTNVKVRRWVTTVSTTADLTYADSAANGMTITVNRAGVYFIIYGDSKSSGTAFMGITVNTSGADLTTTQVYDITMPTRIAYNSSPTGVISHASTVWYLNVNDVVRTQGTGTEDCNGQYCSLTMVRIL